MDKRSDETEANSGHKDKMILTTAHPVTLFLLDKTIKKRQSEYKVVKVTALIDLAKHIRIFNSFCDKESKGHN